MKMTHKIGKTAIVLVILAVVVFGTIVAKDLTTRLYFMKPSIFQQICDTFMSFLISVGCLVALAVLIGFFVAFCSEFLLDCRGGKFFVGLYVFASIISAYISYNADILMFGNREQNFADITARLYMSAVFGIIAPFILILAGAGIVGLIHVIFKESREEKNGHPEEV